MSIQFDALQLTPEAVEVLKGVGVSSVEALADANVTDIQNAFIAASKDGRYPDKFPSLVTVASWVEKAQRLSDRSPEGQSTDLANIPTAVVKPAAKKRRAYAGSGPKSHINQMELGTTKRRLRRQADPEAEVATGAPVTPTPRQEAHAHDGVVEELNPEGSRTLRNRRKAPELHKSSADQSNASSEVVSQTKAATPAPPAAAPQERPTEKTEETQAPSPEPAIVEDGSGSPFKSFDDYKQGRVNVKPLDRHSLKVGEDTSRSTESEQESFEEELVYKKRMPIWRIRGVKHPDGMRVWIGALITFMAIALTALIALGAALFPIYLEDHLEEHRLKFGIFFGAMFVSWALYIITAIGMRCRVCSCHLFYSRRCLKNVKAHRILGAFPMLAQTIHILCWRWFRCMYCGTAIRLKDEK